MVHTDRRLAAVRDAGKVVIEVLDIGFRPAKEQTAHEEQELEEDPRYGPCLEALRSVMGEFDSVEVNEYPEAPSARQLIAERRFNNELLCSLSILYRAEGTGQILVGVETANGTIHPVQGEDLEMSPLQVGRYVAQAELAILVAELGSCAEALDYWIKKDQNLTYDQDKGKYMYESDSKSPLASSWHTTRGVTKQAVSNNANSASNSLHKRSEDSDPWI
ncbi:hypothetical protein [Halorubrum trapanicum]|uniref:hypothetical protein n=1 Tax=Halorubrum trapanicum TaxID=29284 RepID=UPI003C6EB4DD